MPYRDEPHHNRSCFYAVFWFLHKDLHKNSKGYEKKWQTKMNEKLYDLEQKRNAVELDIQALYETLQQEINEQKKI